MKSKKTPEPLSGERPLRGRQLRRHKKTKFKRQESWRYARVEENWRKPLGVDSKMRKKVKGWPPSPEAGYRGPKKTRGLHPSRYVEVRVQTTEDVNAIDPENQAIRIGRTVGGKKRVEILTLADERGIHVLNPRTAKEPEVEEEEEEEEEEEVGEKEKEETK